MLKITVHDAAGGPCLKLEGRLAGCWVHELDQYWRTSQSDHPNEKYSVDLRDVTFVDQAGQRLLRSMHRDGVNLVACGLMIQDILDENTTRVD